MAYVIRKSMRPASDWLLRLTCLSPKTRNPTTLSRFLGNDDDAVWLLQSQKTNEMQRRKRISDILLEVERFDPTMEKERNSN